MIGKSSLKSARLIKIALLAGALLIAAAAYGVVTRSLQTPETTDDRSFGPTGSECSELNLGHYTELISPIYLPWEELSEVSRDERPDYAYVTCTSQTSIDEDFCDDTQSQDCIDRYAEPVSVVSQFRVSITYYEDAAEAAGSIEASDYQEVAAEEIWDENYQATAQLSWGAQMELSSIVRADNLTIEVHSIIGEPIQTEAIMNAIFEIHAEVAKELAQAAKL